MCPRRYPQVKREKGCSVSGTELRVFVATDVAARGIDVDDAWMRCSQPRCALRNEYYIHRIGRTPGQAPWCGIYLVSDYGAMVRLDEIAKFTRNAITAAGWTWEAICFRLRKDKGCEETVSFPPILHHCRCVCGGIAEYFNIDPSIADLPCC